MTDTAAAPFEPDNAADDPRLDAKAERVERQVRILGELAEIGLRLARTLERQAEAQAAPAAETDGPADGAHGPVVPPHRGDLGLSFDRLARAIRLTLMLQARIDEGEVGRQAQVAEGRAKAAQAAQSAELDAWADAQAEAVLGVIEQTLEADGQDDETIIERLRETREYLDSGDEDYDVFEAPVGLVIARICKEFGVAPDWALWAGADWAIEEARDRPRGSPYARGGFGGEGSDAPPDADTDLSAPSGGSP